VESFSIKTFLDLFIVIDPIGLAPIFITLAGSRPPEEQFGIVRQAILVSGGILLAFALGGNWLLASLGISIEAFQVATGILLFKVAVDLVFEQQRETEEEQEARVTEDISVFPLAIPLIAGPGTLASLVILQNESEIYVWGWLIVAAIALIVLLITYVLLYFSVYLANFFNKVVIQGYFILDGKMSMLN
jgi:multiple antibiotic resistance protein